VSDLCLSTQPLEVLWAGVPCETFSKAKEIPINILGRPGLNHYAALSFQEASQLSTWDQLKVSKAHHIYGLVAFLIHQLVHSRKIIIIKTQGVAGCGTAKVCRFAGLRVCRCRFSTLQMVRFIIQVPRQMDSPANKFPSFTATGRPLPTIPH